MDRRDFLKTAGLAAGATLLSGMGIAGMTAEKGKGMKIVVLTGSPRLNGNTNHMASQFIKGAEEAGHEVYRFDCTRHKVAGCIGCNACGMNGDCFMQDDFSELRPHLLEADMVVFVTPMYYFGFSSQLKAVIDRFYAVNGRIKGASKQSVFLMAYANTAPQEAESGDGSSNSDQSGEMLILMVPVGDHVYSYQHTYEQDQVLETLPKGCRSLGQVGSSAGGENTPYTDGDVYLGCELWIAGEGWDGPVYLETPEGVYLECIKG